MRGREVLAPNVYHHLDRPYVFLAGSIDMGNARNWQAEVVECLSDMTILNPRRVDWDSSWVQSIDNAPFKEQVEWELLAMEDADLIIFHFEPGSLSPITLLELGLFKSKALVHCPDGFWRKGNVDIICQRYGVPTFELMDDLLSYCHTLLERQYVSLS